MLSGDGWSMHTSAALPLGKNPYQMYQWMSDAQGQFGWVRKITPPLEFEPRTIQSIMSCYTDCAISLLIVVLVLAVKMLEAGI